MLHRKDLSDDRDPNPDKDQDYQQPELRSETIADRDFAGENIAADQRQQGDARYSAPPERGNRTDDVQASDRSREGSASVEGEADDADRAHRTNAARTQLDAERRSETDENL